MTDTCSFLLDDGETRCARQPITADYYAFDVVTGSAWLASLCQRHHSRSAKAFAIARDWTWTEREPAVGVVGPYLERIGQ